MKLKKAIILNIPEAFAKELNKHLTDNPPSFKYDIIYFYYIVHYILEKQLINHNRNEDENKLFIPINKDFMKSVTVSNIDKYIKYLQNGEFIISDNYYIPALKSFGYIINTNLLKGVVNVEVKTNSKLFKKIIKNQNRIKAHDNRIEPFLKLMKDKFMKLDFDYINAEKWILNQPNEVKKASYMIALSLLKNNKLRYFNRNKTNNRLDTNLTNLKKDLRQFIIGDYVSIDLKNSQPFFLNFLLKSIISNTNSINNNIQYSLCSENSKLNIIKTFGIKWIKKLLLIHQNKEKSFLVNLKSFNDSVCSGTLYDDFIKSYSNGITRNEVKKIMFGVMFSKNEFYKNHKRIIPFEKEKKVFATVYPFIYESIKILKSKNNSLLAVFLQKTESYIFIDCIAKELVNAGIVPLTIHDSVIVKTEQKEKTIEIINKVFIENFNVIPTLEIEKL